MMMSNALKLVKDVKGCNASKKSFALGVLAGVAGVAVGAAAVLCAVKLKQRIEQGAQEDFVEISPEEDVSEAEAPAFEAEEAQPKEEASEEEQPEEAIPAE